MSRDLTRTRDQRVMLLHGQEPIKISYHPAEFGGHKHSGSGDIIFFILSCDLDVMTLRATAWAKSCRCTCLPILLIIDRIEIEISILNPYINSYMDTLEKTKLTASIRHIAMFLKSGISIYNPEVPYTAGRKTGRRNEEKHWQLQK